MCAVQDYNQNKGYKLIYYGFTFFLAFIAITPFLAPILAHYGFKRTSDLIYEIYSFFCHQKAHRSAFIFDEQCAWCVRDTFIWSTLFVIWIFLTLEMRKRPIKGISLLTAFILCVPMALDGGIQLIATVVSQYNGQTPFYESTNTLRAITGTFFGLGLGMYLFPRLLIELLGYPQQPINNHHNLKTKAKTQENKNLE